MDILADLGRSNRLLGRQVDTPAQRFRDLDGIFSYESGWEKE